MSKKILSVILTLVMCLSLIASLNVTVLAASLPTISKNKPLITYTYSSTGKVYAYKEASLKNKTGGYIACATDECKIIEINGNAVKVTYPVSGGTKTAWFSREAFTYRDLAKDGAQKSFDAQVGVTTYRWKNNYTKMGSVSKNDKCYLLRGKETSDWVQIIYPVTGGHKMAWVTGSDYCKMIGVKPETKAEPSNNDSYTEKVNAFLSDSRFKNGASWGASKTPVLSSYRGTGCCAYAADFAKYVFGKSTPVSGTKFTNPKDIKAGDVIKVLNKQHWFVVISRNGNSLKVAEGNWDGKVVVSEGVYTVKDNTLYRNGKKFRTFAAGYHFQ